ncbi:Na+/proline symporter [Halogeometricum borinquense DSM 11551]|uniref:Na+/proline symporter n=1 Tax=Halogeometricum borinquense (strain ATCC 700274 / DSM 11551 / JCM 10706 / KCTC 4070 / PR3) TaxID=469382 RepID=E4NNI1_HALBP|nr:sodium:solute symporter family protein [Halogeometricum borinquense]ADQ66335.1 Na+/proline symporter [Halogeometricum borinquense DSM 11551]ELY27675.1 Na+/proline symporter [Halogeometricum borinquense DSM 11551]
MAESDLLVQMGVVGVYLVVSLLVGFVAYRLTSRDAEDYYLASRSLGTVVLLFTTFATLLSAFTFFGGPNLAYGAGPEWILVMGLMDGVLFAVLWYAVGYRQWLIGQNRGYVTLGEMLGDRFGSRALRAMVATISLFWLFPYVMLQQMGAGEAIVGLTGGTVPYWAGAALITVFMILYVVLAGLRGVAWTDTIQGLFMLSIVWVAVAWVVSSAGGLSAISASMAETKPEFLALGGGLYSPEWMISTAVTIAFGVIMFPQINQRFFMAKDDRVLKRSFALWPILVLLLFVPAFLLGSWAAGLGVQVPEGSNVIPALLNEYTPVWFAALVVAGAMAAMMSSSDSMLLSGSSYLTRDLYRPFVNPTASDEREGWIARIGVAVFATLSFVASLFQPGTLINVGDTAFGGFAQMALPVMVALYWPKTTKLGMLAGIGGGQVFYILHVFLPELTVSGTTLFGGTYFGWDFALWGMLLSFGLTVGVSYLTPAAADEDAGTFAVGSRAD